MLKFGNKEFRNLQEQVEENMKDIEKLKSGQAVLDEFGIKVVGEVSDIEDLPTVAEYKESTPDWEYGDTFAVGTDAPYTLYILTRANETHEADYWFDIGEFPAPGPQGPQGPQGPEGQQGPTGPSGADGAAAGFGTPTATAAMTTRGSAPVVNVTATGSNTEKVFNFDFYLPVATPKVTITSASGTLTLAEYNILYNFEDSVVVFKPSSSLAHTAYTLQRWYANDDYIVFVCFYNYTPYKTSIYRCRVDRSNRSYLIYADETIKINKWNISTAIDSSTNETAGKVLTADGNGGASWEDAGSIGSSTVTITVTSGTFSDSDYLKVASDGCTLIYNDNTTKVSFRKYTEDSTTITYAGPFTENNITYWYGITVNKSGKTWVLSSAAMPISTNNIKSGSYVSGLVLTTNGSGGSSWESLPAQTQSDWNVTSTTSPAYIKNKPTIPTIPVTDVTVNGTSCLDGTVAKVVVNTVDGTIGGTSGNDWTSLTINGSTAYIPAAQVQADWSESDNTKVSYIDHKPTLGTAAAKSFTTSVTSGSGDLVTSGAVYTAIDNLPEPMVFKGSLGTGGTITSLPAASSANEGFVYKVIEDGTYASQAAKIGDTFISDGSDWVLIPSGDEPSGTVTSVGVSVPTGLTVSNTPITSSGTIAIALDTGYEIPTTSTLNSFAVAADLATVATSGDYDDLLNKPTIPDVSHMVTDNTTQSITGLKKFEANTDFYNDISFYSGAGYLEGTIDVSRGSLDLVGFSGFKDVSSTYKLLIPSTTSYTADKTIATTDQIPVVPTNISSFTNDSGYITGINSSDVTTALGYTPLNSTACTYQTTAPTAAIADGGVHIVYLSAEPATKYSGYIYMIAEA